MSTLADLLILNLGTRFAKLLIESWVGKGARSTIAGDVLDVFKGRIQSVADRKKAEREFDELGDRMARELLPLFEDAVKRGYVEAEAVVLALESTLAGLTNSSYLIQKDLDPGAILTELKQIRPLPAAQFSQAEADLYGRALESSVRHLVEVASRLPQFEEAFAAHSLQQLSRLTGNVDEILARVRRIEATVGAEVEGDKARKYEIDYRLAVQRNLDYLEIFGIELPPESRTQKLSVAYVSLNLESRSRDESESLPAESLFNQLGTHQRLLIRGDAGSGKSTLLRWAAMKAAAGNPSTVITASHNYPGHLDGLLKAYKYDELRFRDVALIQHLESDHALPEAFQSAAPQASRMTLSDTSDHLLTAFARTTSWRERVPFLIRLRQCRGGSLPSPLEFPELISQALGGPPADWVMSVLKEGRALLLLDGVDEIPNSHREITRRGIADLVAQYPTAYFVISTRPRAVDPDWLASLGFREARINPLSDLDRARFVDRWHEAVCEELKERGKAAADLADLADSLKKQLEDNPEVARLATNPLLCAMICGLHRDRRQKLPERQRQLCEDLCQALLHRRERESGLDLAEFPEPYRRLDYPQKRAAVQELAHHMVLNEYSSLPTEEAQEQIGRALKQFPGHSADDAHVVTDSLVERSGILREESPGEISFIHNAFKELLAGDYFAGEGSAGLLANHVLDPTWQPVILFAVAVDLRGFATKVIKRILEPTSKISKADLRARQLMALRCRAAALYVEEYIDLRLQQLTADLFPPRNMEDAEALATGGNTAVSFLVHRDTLKDSEAAACIRTLRLIGTAQARQALRDFLGDRRETVISELAQAVNPLEIEWVREQLLAGMSLPEGIATQVADLSPLAELSNLQILDLCGTQAGDISPLTTFNNLKSLDLTQSHVKDISPLATLSSLRSLFLSGTQVTELSPLAGLNNLEILFLSGTRVADISPLAELSNLRILYLSGTQVTDISPLAGLNNLKSLNLSGTPVTDLSPLRGLNQLKVVGSLVGR